MRENAKKVIGFFTTFCLLISCFGASAFASTQGTVRDAVQVQADNQIRVDVRDGAGEPKAYYELDGNNQLVEATATSDPMVTDAGGLVQLSKTVEATGIENEFDITLNVTTAQDMASIRTAQDAAVILVMDISGSMAWDVAGNEISNRNPSVSRLELAQSAAKSFLDDFTRDAEDTTRLVSFVTFGDQAQMQKGWMQINPNHEGGSANLREMKMAVDNLSPQESTNMEGAFLVVRNLLKILKTGSDQDIESVNVILLTDGEPTASMTESVDDYETLSVGGAYGWNLGASAEPEDFDDVPRLVHEIKTNLQDPAETPINAKLYTIGFALKKQKVGEFETGNDWLASFATRHWAADEADKLTFAFENIVSTIQRAAYGFRIIDPMGDFIIFDGTANENAIVSGNSDAIRSYDGQTRTITWKLDQDQSFTEQDGESGTIRQYNLTYRVKLDTAKTGFVQGTLYPVNKYTTLTYVVSEEPDGKIDEDAAIYTVPFKVPAVHGYVADFSFVKKEQGSEKEIAGAMFALLTGNPPMEVGRTISAGDDSQGGKGQVIFQDIPSGFSYAVREISAPKEPVAYTLSDKSIDFKVEYGQLKTLDGKELNCNVFYNEPVQPGNPGDSGNPDEPGSGGGGNGGGSGGSGGGGGNGGGIPQTPGGNPGTTTDPGSDVPDISDPDVPMTDIDPPIAPADPVQPNPGENIFDPGVPAADIPATGVQDGMGVSLILMGIGFVMLVGLSLSGKAGKRHRQQQRRG